MKRSSSLTFLRTQKKKKKENITTIHDIPAELIAHMMTLAYPFSIVMHGVCRRWKSIYTEMYRPSLGLAVHPIAADFFEAIRSFPLKVLESMCEWLWHNVQFMEYKINLSDTIMMGAFASGNREAFIWFRCHGLNISRKEMTHLFCMGKTLDMLDIYARYTGKTSAMKVLEDFPKYLEETNFIVRNGNTSLFRAIFLDSSIKRTNLYMDRKDLLLILKKSILSGSPEMTNLVLEYTDIWTWFEPVSQLRIELSCNRGFEHLRNVFEWSERTFMEKHFRIIDRVEGKNSIRLFVSGWDNATKFYLEKSPYSVWPTEGQLPNDYVFLVIYIMENILPNLLTKRLYYEEPSIVGSMETIYIERYKRMHSFASVCIPLLEYYYQRWWAPLRKDYKVPETFLKTKATEKLSPALERWIEGKKEMYPKFHVQLSLET